MSQDTTFVCPNCLKETPESAHFCAGCGVPLSPHASTDPLARIRAMGHVFGKATSRPPSRMVLIGMWLIFAPIAIWKLFQIGAVCNAWLASTSPPETAWAIQIDPDSGAVETVEMPGPQVRMNHAPFELLLGLAWLLGVLAISTAILWKVTSNFSRGSPDSV